MPHPILRPDHPNDALRDVCALAIMAKAPRPGKVKTRLAPPLTPDQSAAINVCFLKDTAENIASVTAQSPAAGIVSYTPVGDEGLFEGLLPAVFSLIPQRGEGFGERLLATAQDLLACGFGAACLIDSDSPTLPVETLERAVDELMQPGDRVVLGPASDGGYYLIGLKYPHAGPFSNISWSTSVVYDETVIAVRRAGIELVELPLWYDVDDEAALRLLRAELLHEEPPPFAKLAGYAAPHTQRFLCDLDGWGSAG